MKNNRVCPFWAVLNNQFFDLQVYHLINNLGSELKIAHGENSKQEEEIS